MMKLSNNFRQAWGAGVAAVGAARLAWQSGSLENLTEHTSSAQTHPQSEPLCFNALATAPFRSPNPARLTNVSAVISGHLA
jgi:hypothetical protein